MQAERTPTAIALTSATETLTYSQLNARANQLANLLRAQGVGPEVLVGLCVGRSTAMVVGLLAVLKAGGAYVPLDPAYPAGRLAFMVDDARASVLVAQADLLERLPGTRASVICLDRDRKSIEQECGENLPGGAGLLNLAYVIYTSGSTGRPKGAMINHLGLANYLSWCVKAYSVPDGVGAPVHSSISFDLTITALLAPLITGRRVDLLDDDLGVEQLSEALRRSRDYSLVKITPAHLRLLGDQMDARDVRGRTRAFIIGGEQLREEHVAFWRQHAPDTHLINEYGPTETVVGCCVYRVPRDQAISGAIPIGRPIANTRLYVVNRNLEPMPIGVPGELFIGGAGVARGYLNRPGLTAERFVPDPFGNEPGSRLYRTGDLARWRSDGNLECLGRVDRQVKIRGYRIEPGEIEQALELHPAVRETAVVAREDVPDDRRLVAYLTIADDLPSPTSSDLRQFLRHSLPEPMIPSAFVVLEALPLTPNGKVDREALPAPLPGSARQDSLATAPRGPVEQTVASIWADVLRLERVGAHDGFFDIGGHSLLATQVISRLREAFGVEIPLRALFEAPTVAGLATRIEAMRRGCPRRQAASIESSRLVGPMPLSFSQEALWFLDQLAPGQPTFNVTAGLRITGPLDFGALEWSLKEVVRRHEALRTSFISIGGTPVQSVEPDVSLSIEMADLTALALDVREQEAQRLAIDESRRPFDLTRAPLARVSLLRLGKADSAVLLTMHHLITDGWSFSVAAGELATLYEAYCHGRPSPLPGMPIQYADFARWQRDQLQTGAWSSRIESWRRRLAGVPSLELPTDRLRLPLRSARGALHHLVLTAELSAAVRDAARREGVTPFMTLLAAFQLVLGRWSGQNDFAVGAPVANRNRPETERLIGYFVNMVALRVDLSGNPTVRELLARVREVALEAYENQEIPLEVLIAALGPRRDASRSPLFQVMFVLQNNSLPAVRPLELTFSPLDLAQGTGTSKFDLSLGFDDTPQGFIGSVEFNTDLFDAPTIERFAKQYVQTLEFLIAHPERSLSELSLLTDVERGQVAAWSQAPSEAAECVDIPCRHEPSAIHGAFEAQVLATPGALALVAGHERLTYADLNVRANRLAHHLRAHGAGPEARVGISINDFLSQIVAVLGVLKAGAAYVPLETSLPRTRLHGMLDNAGVSFLIADGVALGRIPHSEARAIDLDAERANIASQSPENPSVRVHGENLAYVVFTSGSTGRPKGVMVSHRGLLAASAAWEQAYDLRRPPLRHLQAAGFAFDVFTGDWVRALTTGGTLVACPRPISLDPAALTDLIRRERIECLELVPALANALATHLERRSEDLGTVRLLAVGSDTLRGSLYRRLWRLMRPGGRVVNSYGLTEATIDSTYFGGLPNDLEAADGAVPIGRPLLGTRTYILDGVGEPVPVGVVGELYIGGSGVARGYVGDPRQTAERFVPDPNGGRGSRMYATGDRARWRPGGTIELLGRRDAQVKVRGFRVELAEVEAAISRAQGVREAAVITEQDEADSQRLVACVVAEAGQSIHVESIRLLLRETLPRPMIPSRFHVVDRLPRTHSGKVDRLELLQSMPDEIATDEAVVSPRDEIEKQLATIWEDLLQKRPIGVTDDFFDLGGHSLLAVRLAARIEEQFGRSLALSDLLLSSTIEELATQIREVVGSRVVSPLVNLGASGSGWPLYLVHPIGGGVICYSSLARGFDGARAVLGLQAAGYEGDEEPETDLVRMASRYVDVLRADRPGGPYILGGWSMGGIVAFEMAIQLAAAGHDAPLVILIDCSVPVPRNAPHSIGNLAAQAGFAADLARIEGGENWASRITGEIGEKRLRRLQDVYRANRLALDGYQPRAYSGRVILVQAEANLNNLESRSTDGWKALALGGISTHQLPGDHYTIMQRPTVLRLAEILAGEIEHQEQTLKEDPIR